jgi:hypothetical protein
VQSVGALLASFDCVSSHVPVLVLLFAVVAAFAEARAATAAYEHGQDPNKNHHHRARDGKMGSLLDKEND